MIIDRVDEEFLLFALHPDGRWGGSYRSLRYGVAAAWLAELMLEARIRLDRDRAVQKTRYEIGDPTLDMVLQRMLKARRNRTLSTWVYRLARISRPGIDTVMVRLKERGYVDVETAWEKGRRTKRYPQHSPGSRREMRGHLVEVLSGKRAVEDTSLALLAVIDGAGFCAHVFGEAHAEEAHQRVLALLQRDHRFQKLHRALRTRHRWGWFAVEL